MLNKIIGVAVLVAGSVYANTNGPNVIVVYADDISAREIPIYGSTVWSPPPGGDTSDPAYFAATPVMDMMATNGVWFRSAWASVICGPSRAMMMTGRYASAHKWWYNDDKGRKENGAVWDLYESSPLIIGKVAQQAGYRTMWCGKTQMNNYNSEDYGFDEGAFTQGGVADGSPNPYTDFELKNVSGELTNIDTGLPVASFAQRSWYWQPSVSLWRHPDAPTETIWWPFEAADQAAYGLSTYGPDVEMDLIMGFMERSASSNTPFFVYHTSHLGHDGYNWLGQPEDVKWPGTPIVTWDGTNYSRTAPNITGDIGVYDLHGTVTDMGIHEHVNYLDYQLWQYIEKMKELGIEDNTILIFCADNGTHSYGKGSGDRQKGTHVPLIIYAPGVGMVRQGPQDELVSMADFLPTLAEVSGAEIPADYEIHGKSFWTYLTETNSTQKEWIYSYKNGDQLIRGHLVMKDGNDKWWDISSTPSDLISFPEITDWNTVSLAHRDERDALLAILPEFDNYALEHDPPHPPSAGSAQTVGTVTHDVDMKSTVVLRTASTMKFDDDIPRYAYMQFDVSGYTPGSGDVRLWLKNASCVGTVGIFECSNGWDQATVDWVTKPGDPATSPSVGTIEMSAVGEWYSISVSNIVTSDGTYSFGMTLNDTNSAADPGHINSMESGSDAPYIGLESVSNANYDMEYWLYENGLYAHEAGEDADNDGMVNSNEYVAGSNPRNSTSLLTVDGVPMSGSNYGVSFESVSSRLYDVEYTDSLGSGWNILSNGIPGNGGTVEIPDAYNDSNRFYRVRVSLP
ncbi:sulfatase-like hydrolase/transferase [Pontiella sulfatireligans]|uniref:Arylsulfatase n=1 Tax=Pontiella sulfatireligans TaxID=2750658 RepID=A0A6C2UU79_9BACT|nr:sulfatase-like hydrolase/transferase [Pontiella sulfatireligans]SPS74508.1 sulfatase S1_24 [Kiritimatiellales bacterium]VGO22446.1 Arylsulfatase [Pontiella sulfatireligans]